MKINSHTKTPTTAQIRCREKLQASIPKSLVWMRGIFGVGIKLAFLLIGTLFILGCGKQLLIDPPFITLKGVSLSFLSSQAGDFSDFFTKAKQAGEIVSWAGDWYELTTFETTTYETAPFVIADLAATYNYIPLIETQCFNQATGQLLRPLNDANNQLYMDSAAAFAKFYQPKYLAFGIEVNILSEKSSAEFESFVRLFDRLYDSIKDTSPATQIFTIFQLEKMKGLNGGLFGGSNDASQNQWALLDRFPKADIVAFTSYPDLIYKSPSDIPVDYFSSIRDHTTKPIAFTELGWHSAAEPLSWESSESDQAEFIKTFFTLAKEIKPEFAIWPYLYDPDTTTIFKSMGLYRRSDGLARPAWKEWLAN